MVPFPDPPAWARAGLMDLASRDQDLARIEREAGPLPWRTRTPGFACLLNAIVGQQISNQAAAAIWNRLIQQTAALVPADFLSITDDALRGAGLSRPKIAHARALAAAFQSGQLSTEALEAMDDAIAVTTMTQVRGIGPWSAEIYLLFALQRPDVMPAGDVALQAAFADVKRLPARPSPTALRAMTAAWSPYRSLGARLLWHWWRHITGRPSMDDDRPPQQ